MRSHNSPSPTRASDSRQYTQNRSMTILSMLLLTWSTTVADGNRMLSESVHPIPQAVRDQGVISDSFSNASVFSSLASTRIINGFEVDKSQRSYPYTVSLEFGGQHFCGGALIGPDIAITAGHCSGVALNGIRYNVVAGRHDLDQFWKGQSIKLKNEIRHPGYTAATVDNDFNLIFLQKPVAIDGSGDISFIKLNRDASIPAGPRPGQRAEEGDPVTVVGWGDTDQRENVEKSSDVLMETEVYTMTNDVCEEVSGLADAEWGPVLTSMNGAITGNMLCARADETDACQGDSGGPLIKRGEKEDGSEDVLVGIVSWGLGCADEVFPGVYSRISSQYDWIQEQVCEFSSDPPEWFNCNGELNTAEFDITPLSPPPTSQPVTPVPTPPITPAPTLPPIPSGKERMLVKVELDGNPIETGWSITTLSSGDPADELVIKQMPIGSYNNSNKNDVFDYEIIVDSERFYKITIYDSVGNGFGGTIVIYKDGIISDSTRLVNEPGFTSVSGTSVTHGFYAGNSPEQFVTLDFQFDYFAHEVAYELKNSNDGIIFALAWFHTFEADVESASMTIPIYSPEWGDQEYSLMLWDDGDDGICCSWGDGGYQLYLGAATDNNKLRDSDGSYGSGESFTFAVAGNDSPTRKPSKSPTLPPTTSSPTSRPSMPPSLAPSRSPTNQPTSAFPTISPSLGPSKSPTRKPTRAPLPFSSSPRIPSPAFGNTPEGGGEGVPLDQSEFTAQGITLERPNYHSSGDIYDEDGTVVDDAEYTSSNAPSPDYAGIESNDIGSIIADSDADIDDGSVIAAASTNYDTSSAKRIRIWSWSGLANILVTASIVSVWLMPILVP